MPTIVRGDKVLVSGANGYIPIWITRTLLERGYSVRGTVRIASKGEFMKEYFASLGYGDKFEFVVVEDITTVCIYVLGGHEVLIRLSRTVHSMKPSKM